MLYKLIAAALLISSGEALNLGAGVSRLAAPAFALVREADADIYKRADGGKLNAARAIERTKAGKLVDGSSATCGELEKIIAVDAKAVQFEKDKLEALGGGSADQKKIVLEAEKAIEKQIQKLKGLQKSKGC